jgi:hypothetical protein
MIVSTFLLDNGLFGGFFSDNKVPINRGVASIMYENQFIKGIWNGTEWTEGATAEEITELQTQTLKANETQNYLKRAEDGIKAYAEISAEFRLAKLSGVITEQQHGAIENTLIPVRNEVLAGQWISALQKLEAIGVAIGSELYDRLHNQITNYIAENYDLPN